MEAMKINRSFDWQSSISVCDLIEAVMDASDRFCVTDIRKKDVYDNDRRMWLGFVNNTPVCIEHGMWHGKWSSHLSIKWGEPMLIATMMTAILQRDGLPFIVQANTSGTYQNNEIKNYDLNFYEVVKDNELNK